MLIERVFLDKVGPWIVSPPDFFRRTFWHGVFRIKDKSDAKKVYLTFDDGPIPESTPWLLDELDRLGVKATFFMVGDNVRKYPDLYYEVLKRGHQVGNHTMHHLDGSKTWATKYVQDVKEAARYIDSDLFRPPHGWMRITQKEVLHHHFRIIMYDIVTRDYSKWVSAEDVIENVRRNVRPGSIIVFHDSKKSIPRLRPALAEVVEWLRIEGYKFELIPGKEETKEEKKRSLKNR